MQEQPTTWEERNKTVVQKNAETKDKFHTAESVGDGRTFDDAALKPVKPALNPSEGGSHALSKAVADSSVDPVVKDQKKKWDQERKSVSRSPTRTTAQDSVSTCQELLDEYSFRIGMGVFVVILAVLFFWLGPGSNTDGSRNSTATVTGSVEFDWEKGKYQFKQYIAGMKKDYPSQTFETRTGIYSAVISTMSSELPRQPSAVVFLTPPDLDTGFAPCLAREIARNVHSVYHNVTGLHYTQKKILEIDPEYFRSADSISDIHDDLKTYLKNGKVVIINNVQDVKQEDHLMIFHAFCDNTAAPDKRATFVFIVPVPQNIYKKHGWEPHVGADISQEILNSSWNSLSKDKKPAVIARVATNIVMLKPGDRCVNK